MTHGCQSKSAVDGSKGDSGSGFSPRCCAIASAVVVVVLQCSLV